MRKTVPVGNAVFKYENTIKLFFSKPFEYRGVNKERDVARTKRMQKAATMVSCVSLAILFFGVVIAPLLGNEIITIIAVLFVPFLVVVASLSLAYSTEAAKEDMDKIAKINCILSLIQDEGDTVFKMVCEDSGWHLVKITSKGEETCKYSFVFLDKDIYISGDKLEIDWDKMQARVLAR